PGRVDERLDLGPVPVPAGAGTDVDQDRLAVGEHQGVGAAGRPLSGSTSHQPRVAGQVHRAGGHRGTPTEAPAVRDRAMPTLMATSHSGMMKPGMPGSDVNTARPTGMATA